MKTRSLELEMLDHEEAFSEKDLYASLDFMRGVNRFLGGTKVILDYLASKPLPSKFRVLDLGTGGGDIPYEISIWAESQGKEAEILAIDTNAACLRYAKRHFFRKNVRYESASAFDLPRLGQFDYIISSMFFHHLTDEEIVQLLILMKRHARLGFVVNDLYRNWPAYIGAGILSFGTFQKMIRSDAPLSVKRAFREEDFELYRKKAEISGARIRKKAVFRISLEL